MAALTVHVGDGEEAGLPLSVDNNRQHHQRRRESITDIQEQLRATLRKYAESARHDFNTRVRSGNFTTQLGLERYFPHAHKEELARFEEMLIQSARYLEFDAPSFKRFVKANCDPRTIQIDRKREVLRQFTCDDLCVLGLLSLALFLTSPTRVHLNSLAGLIMSNDSGSFNYNPTLHGEVLYIGAIATAIGKIFSGFVIDLNDPLTCFMAFATVSAIAVLLNSQIKAITPGYGPSNRYAVFVSLQTINLFSQAGIYVSGIKFLHDHFRSAQYGRSLVIYAIGGRCGSILSSLVMGSVAVSSTKDWGDGAMIAAILCFCSIFPILLIKLFPHPANHLASSTDGELHQAKHTHANPAPPRHAIHVGFPTCNTQERDRKWRHFVEAIKRLTSWWQRRSFVLMALANAGMAVAVSGEGWEGILSLFTSNALHIPRGLDSASVTIFAHIGGITSLCVGGLLIERLSRPAQARIILFMMSISCFASLGLIGLASQGQNHTGPKSMALAPGARAVYFFIGFSLGYPFFVTVQKFAMNWGGSHAALVSQTLGVFATAVCAIAIGCFGAVASRSFAVVPVVLTAFLFIAWVSMFLFDFCEWSAKVQLKHFDYKSRIEKLLHPNRHPDAEHEKQRKLLLLQHDSFSMDVSTLLDKRHDASYRGLRLLWSFVTFSLAVFVVVALFVSYFWLKNPDTLFAV